MLENRHYSKPLRSATWEIQPWVQVPSCKSVFIFIFIFFFFFQPIVFSLSLTAQPRQNFPYATIEPEEARVIVPDERYDWLCQKYNPKSRVPANLTVYDIAGLTRGASTGAGLGNAFLSHIRAVDAIFEVVRCFDDAEIIHVEGDVNPVRDLEIIADELRLKDMEFAEKALENIQKVTKRGGQSLEVKKAKEDQATVEKVLAMLNDNKDVRKGNWNPKEVSSLITLFAQPAATSPAFIMMNKGHKARI